MVKGEKDIDLRDIITIRSIAERADTKTQEIMKIIMETNKPTNGELAIMIANITGQIEQGFKGVHEQQDKTNGRISKAEERLTKLENWRWYLIGGGTVILFLISLLLKFK